MTLSLSLCRIRRSHSFFYVPSLRPYDTCVISLLIPPLNLSGIELEKKVHTHHRFGKNNNKGDKQRRASELNERSSKLRISI